MAFEDWASASGRHHGGPSGAGGAQPSDTEDQAMRRAGSGPGALALAALESVPREPLATSI